jgi:SAM-dependent methyltransferase
MESDMGSGQRNRDESTIASFEHEWTTFTQADLDPRELEQIFDCYFGIFPWAALPPGACGFDMGCGTGRWARLVAPRVAELHCIDPAVGALNVARENLAACRNVHFHHASTDSAPLQRETFDFGYSLGVLHHIPDTSKALQDCVRLLKPGAPFLVYLYYRFDNRPLWFRGLWQASNLMRRFISRLPSRAKNLVTDAIALGIYWPLSRASGVVEWMGGKAASLPLSFYRRSSLNTLRTDSRDRLGTPLEHRFTQAEIREMLVAAGLHNIRFSEREPYWCAVGIKAPLA